MTSGWLTARENFGHGSMTRTANTVSPSSMEIVDLIDSTGHLTLRVIPRARTQKVAIENGSLKIWVRMAPEDGKANNAVIALLAGILDLPKASINIVQGQTSRNKKVHVTLR